MDLKEENDLLKKELLKAWFWEIWATKKYDTVEAANDAAKRKLDRLLRDKSSRGGA